MDQYIEGIKDGIQIMKDYMALLDRMHCLEYDRPIYQQIAAFRF